MTTFRLDRFLTLFFFHPLQKIGISTGESRIPILMYHSLSRTKMKVGHPYYEIATAPHIFEAHMKFIHQNDYQVIDLGDILEYFAGNFKLTQKPIVISFDDGFKDFYTEAFPILRQYGFPASMFLPTRFIGNNGLTFNGKECLSWDIVRDLNGNGITFGSHTMNHLELYRMQEDEID
ncbi:MAG: polysaccharide deacetylase family protein, partial [Desulfobacterales bacterium]